MTSVLPLWLAAGLYLWQTILFALNGNPGMALTLGAYAVANVGLIWAAGGFSG